MVKKPEITDKIYVRNIGKEKTIEIQRIKREPNIEVKKANNKTNEENIQADKNKNHSLKYLNNENLNLRNRNLFGSMKNYLSSAKETLEKDIKIKQQESIKNKINEEVKSQYDEIKDERLKTIENRMIQLKTEQAELENKILKIEKEMEYNIQSQHTKELDNFIVTKTKPNIYWIPFKETNETKALLENSKIENQVLLDKMKKELLDIDI